MRANINNRLFQRGRRLTGATSPSYLPQTLAYAEAIQTAGGTYPTASRMAIIDNTYRELINNNLLTLFDQICIVGADAPASLVNMANPTNVATAILATFDDDKGWVSTGAGSYIDTNINLSTTTKYTAGSGTFYIYLTEAITPIVTQPIGSRDNATTNVNVMTLVSTANTLRCCMYQNISTQPSATTPIWEGSISCSISTDKLNRLCKNGVQEATGKDVTANYNAAYLANKNVYVLGNNGESGLANPMTSGKLGAWAIGSSLTSSTNGATLTQTKLFDNIIKAHLQAIGAVA